MQADLIIKAKDLAGPVLKNLRGYFQAILKPLRELSRGFSALGRQSAQVLGNISRLAKTTAATFAKVAAMAGAVGYGFKKVFVDVGAQAEEVGRQLNNSLGKEWGATALKEVRAFARASGRELGDLAQVYTNLNEAGLKPTGKHLEYIANLAAKKNKTMAEASADWAKALKGEAKALEDYQVKTYKSGTKLFVEYKTAAGELVREHGILKNAEDMARLMEKISQAKAGGAEAERQETFGGQVQRLAAVWQEFRLQVMDSGPWQYLKSQLAELLAWIDGQDLTALAKEWGGYITEALKAVSEGLKGLFKALKDGAPKALAIGKALGGLKTVAAALGVVLGAPLLRPLGGLIKSIGLLGRTLAFTPVGILTTLGIALVAIAQKAGILEPLMEGLSKGFEGFSQVLSPAVNDIIKTLAESFGLAADNLKDMGPEFWRDLGEAIATKATGALREFLEVIGEVLKAIKTVSEFTAKVVSGQDKKVMDPYYDFKLRNQKVLNERIKRAGKDNPESVAIARKQFETRNAMLDMARDNQSKFGDNEAIIKSLDALKKAIKEDEKWLNIDLNLRGQVDGANVAAVATVKGKGISGETQSRMGFGGVTH